MKEKPFNWSKYWDFKNIKYAIFTFMEEAKWILHALLATV